MRGIEVLGAAGEVTGSAYALESNSGTKVLVDCGLFQGPGADNGKRNKSLNGHNPDQFAAIFITHAHLDHLGRLPHLHRSKGPIYMTPPTQALAGIVLRDADKLSPWLYEPGSVDDVLKKIISVPYNSPIQFNGLTATFTDAGHILGSATLAMREKGGDVVIFSGDLGNTPSRIVRPTTPIKEADVVVMETTYGDRAHPKEDPIEVIMDAIGRIKKNNGTLLIPTFAIDRTQIILNIFKKLSREKKLIGISVFLDSPMGLAVTQTYNDFHPLLNEELGEQKKPFSFEGLNVTRTDEESRGIRKRRGPKIIIAGSGMMNGGRIVRHASNHLMDPTSVILFVGYPGEGTPSRAIIDGEKDFEIGVEPICVRGTVLQISGLSAHADQQQLFRWVENIKGGGKWLRKVVLVHGSNPSRGKFAHSIKSQLGIASVSLPAENEIVDLQSNN